MSRHKTGLGRGLGALIPRAQSSTDQVDIDLIVPNPHQPRATFDGAALRELADSIKEHGVLQPLLVSRVSGKGTYQLIAGERRLQAAKLAGLERVPVVIKEATDRDLLELALVENLQREDLNPIEAAQAYKRLVDQFELTQEEVAVRVGKSRAAIANSIRLLALEPEIRASVVQGDMTEGHARALLAIEDEQARRGAWRAVVERGLSVRETEALAKAVGERLPAMLRRTVPKSSPELAALEERLRAALGTRVNITRGRRGGRIVIRFFSEAELDGLIKRLAADLEVEAGAAFITI